jgi:hypothetical protein
LSRRSSCILALPLLLLALPRSAAAQTFPAASAYTPLPCGGNVMVDATGDTPNAAGPLDLVGTAPFPAGFHAADAQFLYLRMRLAADPTQGARLGPNGWGFEIDLDGDRTKYEVLISASGTGATDQVAIFRHPTAAVADSPADPAVVPAAFSYPFTTHGKITAAGSALGGGADSFLDIAVPWTDLANVGIARDTPVYIWAGSSTVANALDLDLACFGGAGGGLSGIDVGVTAPDPSAPGGGGGGGGTGGGNDGGTGGTGPRTLEGGPGCSFAAVGAPACGWLALLFFVALAFRRARR